LFRISSFDIRISPDVFSLSNVESTAKIDYKTSATTYQGRMQFLERILRDLRRRFHPGRFLRGEGPQIGPVTLDRSRVFVLPTRQGVTFALLLCVMLIGSVNYNNSLGLGLTFLLGSMAVVSILHTYHNLAQLTVRAGRAEPVFAGGRARFQLEVDNGSGPARFALGLRTADPTVEPVTVDLHAFR
jgi:hypothetical protein